MTTHPKIKKRSLFTLGAVAALAALCLDTKPVDAAVMAIDYGTDWFKVALVKPGYFDIVLNAESKRKTQSAITVRGDDRAFGSESLSLVRFIVSPLLDRLRRDRQPKKGRNVLFLEKKNLIDLLFSSLFLYRPPVSPRTPSLD